MFQRNFAFNWSKVIFEEKKKLKLLHFIPEVMS